MSRIVVERGLPGTVVLCGTSINFDWRTVNGKDICVAVLDEDDPVHAAVLEKFNRMSTTYRILGNFKDPLPISVKTITLPPDVAYDLPAPLIKAFANGWTLEDLSGAGKGENWGEAGGRGACGLTVAEASLTRPPKDWVHGSYGPWTHPDWSLNVEGWVAPHTPSFTPEPEKEPEKEITLPEGEFEKEITSPVVEDSVAYEQAKEEGIIQENPLAGWAEEDIQGIVKQLERGKPASDSRIRYLWKKYAGKDRKCPSLPADVIDALNARAE